MFENSLVGLNKIDTVSILNAYCCYLVNQCHFVSKFDYSDYLIQHSTCMSYLNSAVTSIVDLSNDEYESQVRNSVFGIDISFRIPKLLDTLGITVESFINNNMFVSYKTLIESYGDEKAKEIYNKRCRILEVCKAFSDDFLLNFINTLENNYAYDTSQSELLDLLDFELTIAELEMVRIYKALTERIVFSLYSEEV